MRKQYPKKYSWSYTYSDLKTYFSKGYPNKIYNGIILCNKTCIGKKDCSIRCHTFTVRDVFGIKGVILYKIMLIINKIKPYEKEQNNSPK